MTEGRASSDQPVHGPAAARRSMLLWDLPTRIVHWLIALLAPFSWWSASHDHLPWHRLSGYTVLGLLVFRLIWGFAGGGGARFAGFLRGPREVLAYLRGRRAAFLGHNPLGGWSVAAMLAALVLQVGLGLFSVDEDGLEAGPLARFVTFAAGRAIARIHHLTFWLLVGLVALHLAAIGFYELRGARITLPMITGRALLAEGSSPPRPARLASFLLAAAVALAVAWFVAHGLRLRPGTAI
ncbi:MAG TPA: cytochrome b/b6 domain-containing protein [Caulobacteraceae bacterium]